MLDRFRQSDLAQTMIQNDSALAYFNDFTQGNLAGRASHAETALDAPVGLDDSGLGEHLEDLRQIDAGKVALQRHESG